MQRKVTVICQQTLSCSLYGMKKSLLKTKAMVFIHNYPIRAKIVIINIISEHVSQFNYFDCDISYDKDKNIRTKKINFNIYVVQLK